MASPGAYTCRHCGAVSHHPRDAAEGYCNRCKLLADEEPATLPLPGPSGADSPRGSPRAWRPLPPVAEADSDGVETCFACTGCGIWTYSYGLTVCALPPRCGVCTWLHEWVAPEQHQAYREQAGLT